MTELFRKNNQRGGFHENRLIRCVKEKEKELRRKNVLELPPKVVAHDMKLDRWFLTRFSMESAYLGLCEEYYCLSGNESAWNSYKGKANPFLETAKGENSKRQLKCKAQRVGPFHDREYVACEGPTSSSVYDFWCMVWQENVTRVLSVNFPSEERLYPSVYDEEKETIQYWPVEEGQTVAYMPFRITCMESRIMVTAGLRARSLHDMVYRITRLRVSYRNPIEEPQPDREILHLCYYRWPDGRLPIPWPLTGSYSMTALGLLSIVDKELEGGDGPLLVHCHAGLGRTGVYIALDIALRQLRNNCTVNIKGVVEKLREKRHRAVMNPWQYAFINVVVAEKALQLGILPTCLGGHSVRLLIDRMWKVLTEEVNTQFGGQTLTFNPELMQ